MQPDINIGHHSDGNGRDGLNWYDKSSVWPPILPLLILMLLEFLSFATSWFSLCEDRFSNENNVIKIIEIISNLTSVICRLSSCDIYHFSCCCWRQVCCHLLTPSVKNQWSNICECLLYNVCTVLQYKRLMKIFNKVKLNTTFKCLLSLHDSLWHERNQ